MRKIDCHRHCSGAAADLEELKSSAAELDIKKIVLFGHNGMGRVGVDEKVWEWYSKYKELIVPLACDFDFVEGDLEYAVACMEKGFYGFGEILIGHAGAQKKRLAGVKYSDPIPIAIFKLAAKYDGFVLAHSNPIYSKDFLAAVRECEQTTFVWAHIAYDFENKAMPDAEEVERLLLENKNLYFDISFWTTDASCMGAPKYINLLEKYSTRFIFGMDLTKGYLEMQNKYYSNYEQVLNKLSKAAQMNVYYENMNKLLKKREAKKFNEEK